MLTVPTKKRVAPSVISPDHPRDRQLGGLVTLVDRADAHDEAGVSQNAQTRRHGYDADVPYRA